jgi:hypothetical protein
MCHSRPAGHFGLIKSQRVGWFGFLKQEWGSEGWAGGKKELVGWLFVEG